jgi:hypothetical protein
VRVHGNPCVAKMAVDDTGLVFLVLVDPKLHGGLSTCHVIHDRAYLSGSNPGLATGSEKQDRNLAKVGGVASGRTTEKWRGSENVAAAAKPARRSSPHRAGSTASWWRSTKISASLAASFIPRIPSSASKRQVGRPAITWSDRAVIATLAKLVSPERWTAFLVTPETILAWRRALVRRRWTYPHRGPGRPPLPAETVELIVRLARENPRWGYLRIVGELKKLGARVSKGGVANVL